MQGSQGQLRSENAHLCRRYVLRHLRDTEKFRKNIFRDEAATARILDVSTEHHTDSPPLSQENVLAFLVTVNEKRRLAV